MRAIRFFPLAFIANVHGFLIFAPYLALFLTATHIARVFKRWQDSHPARLALVPIEIVA